MKFKHNTVACPGQGMVVQNKWRYHLVTVEYYDNKWITLDHGAQHSLANAQEAAREYNLRYDPKDHYLSRYWLVVAEWRQNEHNGKIELVLTEQVPDHVQKAMMGPRP